jgi:uncharacterized Ntn-hydrolase superfamily protein
MDLSIDSRVSYHRIDSCPFLVDDGVFMKHHCIGFGLLISASLCLAMPNEHSHKPSEKQRAGQRERPVSTFSIVAYDPDRQEWGVAVASKFLAVGAVVPWAKAGFGAIATQSHANTSYGPKGLDLLSQGKSAKEVIKLLTEEDPDKDVRQVGIIDGKGKAATFTGSKCTAWAGGKTGEHYACQGNILTGEAVVNDMAKAFEEAKGPLAWRLLAALEVAEKAGGDKRGKQSAAILVVRDKAGYGGFNDRMVDFRVDDHANPVEELARILALRLKRPEK